MTTARDIAPIGLALLIVLLIPTGFGLIAAILTGTISALMMYTGENQ